MRNGASGRHSFPFPKIYPYPATTFARIRFRSRRFLLCYPDPRFFNVPLATYTEFRLEKCAVFRGIGVTSVFFLSFFWIKVELIRQTSLQWFSVKLSEIFLHLVIDCRNFYDNRIPTFSQLRFSGRIDDVEIVIFQIVRLFFDYITHRDYRVESENNKLTFDIWNVRFLATTISLIFCKFWNLFVRKVVATNREIKLTRLLEHITRLNVRLSNHFVALLHQIGLTASQSVVDYLITLFHYRLKSDSIEAWLVHDLSFLFYRFFAPFVSSPFTFVKRCAQRFFFFNFNTSVLPFKNFHPSTLDLNFHFNFSPSRRVDSGHERTNLSKLCEYTSKQRTIWIRNVSRN